MSESRNSTSKYEHFLDEEIWAFINKTNSFFPEDARALSIDQQRELYNEMCNAFKQQPEQTIERRDYLMSNLNVPVREYWIASETENRPTIIYYHGGGFVVGNLNSHDDVCAAICAHTHFRVISCDYKLAPEFKHPAAFNDAFAVFRSVEKKTKQPVILVGDSAGATLAASVSSKARTHPKSIAGQVLIYPYLGAPTDTGSYVDHAYAPMLTAQDMKYYDNMRIAADQPRPIDDTFAPLWHTDFSKLPTTAIFSAQCDPLCDDGIIYAEKIQMAGGKAYCTIEQGLVHGYLRARHCSTRAQASFQRILLAIQSFGPMPS